MPTYTADVLTEWDNRYNTFNGVLPSITIGPFPTEKKLLRAIKRELDKRFPSQWLLDGDRHVHINSGAGCFKLAVIYEHLTEREQIEREIAELEEKIGDLPRQLATAKAKLAALDEAGV